MEAVAPSPSLYAAVLQTLRSADPWSQPLASVMSSLTEHLTSAEAAVLPEAVADVLPMLRRDRERLRFAAEIASRLDYYEAAAAVANLAISLDDRDLLLEAATLCGNPAVEAGVRDRVATAVGEDASGRIRFDPETIPTSDLEKRLYWQCWPGARSAGAADTAAPAVVLDQLHDPLAVLRLSVRLDEAGASVRRLAPNSDVPPWFGPQTMLVCLPTTRSRVLSHYPRFPERLIITDSNGDNERKLNALLRRVNAEFYGRLSLRRSTLGGHLDVPVWEPEVFAAGVYPTKDAAFLAGTTATSLYKLRKDGFISPRELDVLCWNFRDVVAVRTWKYMRVHSRHPVPGSVVTALSRFAGDAEAVKIGVTSEGDVMVSRREDWVNIESGQAALGMDITDIDDVFQPFDFGGGTVPDLLQASTHTRLHPTVLSGTPHLDGHRISAKGPRECGRPLQTRSHRGGLP